MGIRPDAVFKIIGFPRCARDKWNPKLRIRSTLLLLWAWGKVRLQRKKKNYAEAAAVFRCWKHSRQYTGRPCVGLKGTVVSRWQAEQTALVSIR